MRKQYHFWRSSSGLDAWDVDRLLVLTRDFPIVEVEIAAIYEVDSEYWFDGERERATVRRIVDHVRLIEQVEVKYPIILGHDGRVMDGMHRIARALLEGRQTISAVQFTTHPEPDFRNCDPESLQYD